MNEKMEYYTFALHPEQKTGIYQLKIEQSISGLNKPEELLLIESEMKWKMKTYDSEVFICVLSLSPPVINGKGEDDYEKWHWIFGKMYMMNDGLQIAIDRYGDFRKVINGEQVLENWEKAKKDISKLYVTDDVDDFLKNADYEFYRNINHLYQSDVFINWLFNDIYRFYIQNNKIITPKLLGKHFGYATLSVDQRKWMESIDKERKEARINFDAVWKTDLLDMEAVNNYLALEAPDSCGYDLDYYFQCEGFYQMDISGNPFIKNAEMIIKGTMGDYYSRTDHYTLTKIDKKDE